MSTMPSSSRACLTLGFTCLSYHSAYLYTEKSTCVVLLKSPIVVDPLHILGPTLHHIAKGVTRAIDLLARELHHHDGVAIQELEVHQLHIACIQDGGIRPQALSTP